MQGEKSKSIGARQLIMSEDIFGSQTSSAVHLVTIVDMKGILADVNTASHLTWPYIAAN